MINFSIDIKACFAANEICNYLHYPLMSSRTKNIKEKVECAVPRLKRKHIIKLEHQVLEMDLPDVNMHVVIGSLSNPPQNSRENKVEHKLKLKEVI